MSTAGEKMGKIEAALKAARDARNLAHEAVEMADLVADVHLSEAKDLIIKAEGLIAQARYWQSSESD